VKLPSDDEIVSALQPYGVAPSGEMAAQIRAYISLLLKWNGRISLTTVTDPTQILRFHFGESLFVRSIFPVEKSRLADVGSGAGFPGIPLAMMAPDLTVYLIESNVKKFAFLSEVIRELQLTNVIASRTRMEEFRLIQKPLDFVTARALGQFEDLLKWSRAQLSGTGGTLILWLGESDAARAARQNDWIWSPATSIPGTERRLILSGSPLPQ
jgi:16S rRNA (guanine527-N7)-methyltransferase